jgi:predicted nucleic acid-binding protein
MGDQLCSQTQAWKIYDQWVSSGHAIYVEEQPSLELIFRKLSRSPQAAPKDWADSYLSAFAQASGLRLVTFDQSLARKTQDSLLLTA